MFWVMCVNLTRNVLVYGHYVCAEHCLDIDSVLLGYCYVHLHSILEPML